MARFARLLEYKQAISQYLRQLTSLNDKTVTTTEGVPQQGHNRDIT